MNRYKKDFPILKQKINGKKLVYLDSSATSQKPKAVIDSIVSYYTRFNANIKRGLYPLSEKATLEVENTRKKVARFINAKEPCEIIFVRNTTEGINLITRILEERIKRSDTIVTTIMEHHSNFVPWQQLALKKKANFLVLDITNEGFLKEFTLPKNTKILSLTHASNVLGTINPLTKIIKKVKKENPNVLVIVDAAQSVPHLRVDVQKLGCDLLVFSGHKMMAATGISVLYGKKELLENLPPFLFGGEMISEVSVKKTTFAQLPEKYEAGTPDIAGIISLGSAIDYLQKIGMEKIQKHERMLTEYCLNEMKKIDGLTVLGPQDLSARSGVVSFTLFQIHPHDLAQILGDLGICIRVGHHCAMPLHKRLGIGASSRVSFSIYSDEKDIDALINGIKKAQKLLQAPKISETQSFMLLR